MAQQTVRTDDAMQMARLIASKRFIIQLVVVVACILAVGLYLGSKADRVLDKLTAREEVDNVRFERLKDDIHAAKVAIDTQAAWYQNDYRSRTGADQGQGNGGK